MGKLPRFAKPPRIFGRSPHPGMKRFAQTLALLAFLGTPLAYAGTALDAVRALPAEAQKRVVKLTADNGVPNPPAWYFTTRSAENADGFMSYTVEGGEVTRRKPTLDLRIAFGEYSPINFGTVHVDSPGAWTIATRYAAEQGQQLASASFALQQQGADASPVWSVWCYAPDGSYIGLVKLLADSGDVIFAEKAAPSSAPAAPAPKAQVPPAANETNPNSPVQSQVENLIHQ